jgi:pimeloyl-ACP methyl ester carboxylesterase
MQGKGQAIVRGFAGSVIAIACLSGCASIPPGDVASIQPVAEVQNERVGNAYLFRGFIGVFSTGMNTLGDELNDHGVRAHVYQADQWRSVAGAIAESYKGKNNVEPLVLVGHSYGADNVLRIAQALKDDGVRVDLLITLDPVTPPKVPHNVVKVVNLYQSNGALDKLPWLRGIPLEAERPGSVVLLNQDIRVDRTDLLEDGLNHFNIEKKSKVQAEVIKQVQQVCITRPAWAARRNPASPIIPVLTTDTPSRTPTTNPTQARLD